MCRFWTSPSDLGSKVSRSLIKLIKSKPRIGWIKADIVTSEEANQEINRLRKELDSINNQLIKVSTSAPKGTDNLEQGDDEFEMKYRYYYSGDNFTSIKITWNTIFYILAPLMVDETTEDDLHNELRKYLQGHLNKEIKRSLPPRNFEVDNVDFQTIKVQLIALGLISKSDKKRSIKDSSTYWYLTPYGESIMMKLRARKK